MRAAVDYFIDMGFSLEHALDRYTKPAETMLLSLLKENMPSVYNYGANLLASSPSIHAAKLPLMNPFHAVVLILAYYAVISSGMWVMKNIVKQKFQLKTFSNIHNAFLVWLSGYMCLNIAYQALVVRGYSVFNNDFDDVPESFPLAKHLWLFYFSKIFEFVDTCIMVGKMNFRQVSFLHVYHHSSILAVWWLTLYVCPHTESYFSATLNSFIHVIMYSYYLFSSLGVAKSLTRLVKPYITQAQMIQFTLNMFQATYDLYKTYSLPPSERHTKTPVSLVLMLWVYMWTMLGLFGHFYVKNYKKPSAVPVKPKEVDGAKMVKEE